MRPFFQPASGPSWLGQVLSSIRAALGDIWPVPLRLKDYATVDLPAAADFSGGLVYDSTLLTFKLSDGTNWVRFAIYGSGVTSFNTRTGAVTLTSGDVTTALGFTPVTNARTIATTAPLTGGGDLSANRTFAITAASGAGAGSMSAADFTKLAAITGTNTGDQTITLTGDVTGSGTGSFAATIANGAVTLAKQANMATASVVYRKTAGSGAPEVNTLATLKTDLGLTGTNSGDQTITLTGDVTGSGTGSFAATIANASVTLAKMANMATASLLGRNTAGTGVPEVLSAATSRSLLGLVIGTNVQAWDADLDTWATITPGANVGALLATPNSANFFAAITDETGSGLVVGGTSPTFSGTPIVAAANQAIGGAYNSYANLFIQSTDAVAADKGGAISFGGLGSGSTPYTFGRIHGKKFSGTSGGTEGYLAFETANNDATLSEKVRITYEGKVGIGKTNPAVALDVVGAVVASTYLKSAVYTVATLPAAATAGAGARAAVSDALAPTFLGVIVGGGLVFSGVICDGTNWRAD